MGFILLYQSDCQTEQVLFGWQRRVPPQPYMILTPVSVYVRFTQYCSWPFFLGAFVAISESPQFQPCRACPALFNGRLQRLLAALVFALLP